MSCPSKAVSLTLLESYFSTVTTLREYLHAILLLHSAEGGEEPEYVPRETDGILYRELVDGSYVCTAGMQEGGRIRVFPAMTTMSEVIDRAQERLMRPKARKNVLTTGYRRAQDGDPGRRGTARMGITNYFVNTLVTALQAPTWDTLLHRIGVDAMMHLLTETSVFVALPNGCLCQVTGEPILYMAPRLRSRPAPAVPVDGMSTESRKRALPGPQDHGERPSKRAKLDREAAELVLVKPATPPAEISLFRPRVFYARPARLLGTGRMRLVVGLHPKHILNKLAPPTHHDQPKVDLDDYTDPDVGAQAASTRHLSKYVFPRQYGLRSPFQGGSTAAPSADYSDREAELKMKGRCKTPKRLKPVLPLLDKMLWRHKKCGYMPLRDLACPSKLVAPGRKELDSTTILEMMSERSIELRSQLSSGALNISGSFTNSSVFISQSERPKPRFVEFACSYTEVFRYVALVTDAVIPKSFWGTRANLKLILKYVKTFVTCRRYETLTLHSVLQGFSTSACDWLMPAGRALTQTRVSVSDALKRRELLEEFVFWYFDSFLISLLKTTFYVTESSAFRNRVLYFRQDDWAALCAPLIDRLTDNTFQKMTQEEADEVLRQRRLGFAFVRLLPKETGVRPIVNLRWRKAQQGGPTEQSINQILQATFQILNYERQTRAHLLGASVFSADDVYAGLKGFKTRLQQDYPVLFPKLYFVKVDVQACFDTIEQSKLLQILRELVSEDAYVIKRFGQVSMSTGRVRRRYVKKAVTEDDEPHFLQYASELAQALRNTIFVDQVVYPFAKKQDILHLLESHITENIVKIGPNYFRQVVGIPQGSILSSLLCSFFYGDLEGRLSHFRDDPHSVMLRFIDDYLFVTTSLEKARGFLDLMNKGHPEYGCFISKEKTFTNFDYDAQISNVTEPQQRSFLWCGYAIDMSDLSVSVDYTRYQGASLRNSLTVARGSRPGAAFVAKVLQLSKARSHMIYTDTVLNTMHGIYLNIYQNFILSAMKMHGYLSDWAPAGTKNIRFIFETICKMFIHTFASIRSKSSCKRDGSSLFPGRVQKPAVAWLGAHAFYMVFSRKPRRHSLLIKLLSKELSRPTSNRYKSRFRALVKEGMMAFSRIAF